MSEKRMTCPRCPRYDKDERRCLDGKTNPKSKSDSVAAAEQLGVRALCVYNPFRDALAARMYFPTQPIAFSEPRTRIKPRKQRIQIEIEAPE